MQGQSSKLAPRACSLTATSFTPPGGCVETNFYTQCTPMLELYTCHSCPFGTNFVVNLRQHSDTNHNLKSEWPSKLYHCRNCTFRTHSLLVLLRHVSVQCAVIPEPETCVDAQIITQSASSMEGGCFICEHCPYKTESNIFFVMHVTAEHNSSQEDQQVRCRSPEVVEMAVKRFRCRRCSYQTKWKGSLKIHARIMHSKNVKLYKCKQCQYRTKWKNSLKVHATTQHTESEEIRWFQCEHCPHKAKIMSYLKKHILAKHTPFRQIKWFTCGICPYKTKWKANLKAHLRTRHKCPDTGL